MGHDHDEPELQGDHNHSERAGDHCQSSDKYAEYIESHIETLRAKCAQFNACIDKLLRDESPVTILKGENINLKKICGLISENPAGGYFTLTGKCTLSEREDIRNDIEHHLSDEIQHKEWNRVRRCLTNSYGDAERTTQVDDICGLAFKQDKLCDDSSIHETVETFFNDQIQHLRCTCESLNKDNSGDEHSHFPLPVVVGAGVGALLLILIAIVICFLCYRRKSKKRKERSPKVIYLPAPNSDNHPVYQEIYDDRAFQGYRQSPSGNAPTLPLRYTTDPWGAGKKGPDDEPAYLEPVEARSSFRPQLPKRGQPASNPGYEAPPRYSAHILDAVEAPGDDNENNYFEPIPSPTSADGGYDSLKRNKSGQKNPPAGYESVAEARSSAPLEDAPNVPKDEKQTPVPAKRTKKDENSESPYFVLEKEKTSDN